MSNRWEVVAVQEYTDQHGEKKTRWPRVGVGFTNQNGSINVILEMIPVPVDGQIRLQLQVPLSPEEREAKFGQRGNQQGQQGQRGNQQGQRSNDSRGAKPSPGRGFGPPHRAKSQPEPIVGGAEYTPGDDEGNPF